MTDMNKTIRLQVRNAGCTGCRLSEHTQDSLDVCVTGSGAAPADVMVVSRSMGGRDYLAVLASHLAAVGIDFDECFHTGAVKCRVFDVAPGRGDVKACSSYLGREIELVKPRWILALGNEALQALTGHSGIMKYRGASFDHPSGARIFATISPAMVMRNPGMVTGFRGDMRYFASLVEGRADRREEVHVRHVMTVAGLKSVALAATMARAVAFDIESTGADENTDGAAIVSISCSFLQQGGGRVNFAVPLSHPQSPFRHEWLRVLRYVCRALGRVDQRIAHNGKFDLRWIRRFVPVEADWPLTFDTMLAQHLLDEAGQKGLKAMARLEFGADPWEISTKNLQSTPIATVLDYNGADTHWTLRLWPLLQNRLVKQPRLARLMANLLVPANEEVLRSEISGVWVDQDRLAANWAKAHAELVSVEADLMKWVPGDAPNPVNFNPSNFLRWWLFEHLDLPVLARGKPKDDGRPGDPSVAEAVMMELAEMHEVPGLLLRRTDWARKCGSFFGPWSEQIDGEGRIHTTFKLAGTVTGRLSSGKPDADKVTAKRQIRGVNIQQVPRDPLMRGVFGAPPGWWFVQADQSQVELRIAAEVSGERNMIWHYQNCLDLHTAMAERLMGKSKAEILADPVLAPRWKEIRKRAKPVNFGYLYGMSWMKFQATAWVNYGLRFTDAEAMASRTAFFDMWPDLVPWHAKQKRLARRNKRVESPLGRARHLPDIDSPNREIAAEAERQAINAPVQSLASDLTLLALTLISRRFRAEGMRARVVGTVHDSILFEIPDEEMATALPLIKRTMENPPLERLFGWCPRVPLVADVSVGKHWAGDAVELPAERVYNFDMTAFAVEMESRGVL